MDLEMRIRASLSGLIVSEWREAEADEFLCWRRIPSSLAQTALQIVLAWSRDQRGHYVQQISSDARAQALKAFWLQSLEAYGTGRHYPHPVQKAIRQGMIESGLTLEALGPLREVNAPPAAGVLDLREAITAVLRELGWTRREIDHKTQFFTRTDIHQIGLCVVFDDDFHAFSYWIQRAEECDLEFTLSYERLLGLSPEGRWDMITQPSLEASSGLFGLLVGKLIRAYSAVFEAPGVKGSKVRPPTSE